MATNSLPITTAQEDATQRSDLNGVVYLLSGTLMPRSPKVSTTAFRWSSLEATTALGSFEAYIGPPQFITRAQPFVAGRISESPGVRVPIRNLPFGNVAESLVAVVTDNLFAWEGATASLRVGYLKPGQTAADLAADDWTFLVKDGVLGSPQDINADGFNVVLYPRGSRRNQAMRKMTRTEGPDGRSLLIDAGRAHPVVVGAPDSYYYPPMSRPGLIATLVSGHSQGDTQVTWRPLVGSGATQPIPSLAAMYVHTYGPPYGAQLGTVDNGDGTRTTTLSSGLAQDVPRGGMVWALNGEQDSPGSMADWVVADHGLLTTETSIQDGLNVTEHCEWVLGDGRRVKADPNIWRFILNVRNRVGKPFDGQETIVQLRNIPVPIPPSPTNLSPPALYVDPNSNTDVQVTAQPRFTSSQLLTSKLNFPTGGTGTDNANARDGSTDTAASLGVGSIITLTFNDIQSPFDNGDTTNSVLHVVTQGNIDFTNAAGTTTFGQANGTGGVNREFRFVQASARDFNETVRCVGAGGSGGSVVEVWWEHDASATVENPRDTDVSIGPGTASGVAVGPVMQFARLAFRVPSCLFNNILRRSVNGAGTLVGNPYAQTEHLSNQFIPRPTAALPGLQAYFLGFEGHLAFLDGTSYSAARTLYNDNDVHLNFVLLDDPPSWTELERVLAEQSRSHFYYGPNGHQILFMQDTSGLEDSVLSFVQFRMPGVPGGNALLTQGPLMERTALSDVINRAVGNWAADYLEAGALQRQDELTNSDSVNLVGEQERPEGAYQLTAVHSHLGYTAPPNDDVDRPPGVLRDGQDYARDLMQFYADRYAFPETRFTFDTAWVAHGLDRGSVVRVIYPVAEQVYRNVPCEVERITVSPINAERFTIVARSVGKPGKGLEPAFIWTDVFTAEADGWTTRITSQLDSWDDHWQT